MRRLALVGLILAVAFGSGRPAFAQQRPPLHSEKGLGGTIMIEEDADFQRPIFKDNDGKTKWSGSLEYHRLIVGNVLWGSQARRLDNNVTDMFQCLTALHPWDNIATAGANHAFNMREEPLTYYHRTGPVGAIFSELRTRKRGADAKAPVGILGLKAGTEACYALPGQTFTFYETDPAFKRLAADIDKYYSYISDAKTRGANIDIRVGDRRELLTATKDQKFALLLVDQSETFPVPRKLFTVEAVQLFLDRMTEDGILALHISNKYLKLEPVVARIATELKLVARIWNDDPQRRPGKTASSWVILARKPEHLGSLYSPVGDLLFDPAPTTGTDDRLRHPADSQLFLGLVADHDELAAGGTRKRKYVELNEGSDPRAAWLSWVNDKLAKVTDPTQRKRLELYQDLVTRHGPFQSFQNAMLIDHGHAFRRLETLRDVPVWTDEHANVMIVTMNRDLQRFRKFLGLPTPIEK